MKKPGASRLAGRFQVARLHQPQVAQAEGDIRVLRGGAVHGGAPWRDGGLSCPGSAREGSALPAHPRASRAGGRGALFPCQQEGGRAFGDHHRSVAGGVARGSPASPRRRPLAAPPPLARCSPCVRRRHPPPCGRCPTPWKALCAVRRIKASISASLRTVAPGRVPARGRGPWAAAPAPPAGVSPFAQQHEILGGGKVVRPDVRRIPRVGRTQRDLASAGGAHRVEADEEAVAAVACRRDGSPGKRSVAVEGQEEKTLQIRRLASRRGGERSAGGQREAGRRPAAEARAAARCRTIHPLQGEGDGCWAAVFDCAPADDPADCARPSGHAATTGMPGRAAQSGSPIPECNSAIGDPTTPAAGITSRAA